MAANSERHMEPAKVRAIGNSFQQMAKVLDVVDKGLEIAANGLKVAAFLGLVAAAVWERLINQVRPVIQQLEKTCGELSQDALASAADWERAQQSG